MNMKYIIVGAGISGLSIGQVLKEYGHDVQLFEADSRPGGMVKCDRVHGHLFHRTGGHVFNTKRQDVLDWFWSHFDKKLIVRTLDGSLLVEDYESEVELEPGMILE